MLPWWTAYGSVHVTDPSGCVDGSRLEDELTLLFEEAELEVIDVHLNVALGHDRYDVGLRVLQKDEQIWSRTLALAPGDCPAAPEAAALSIHQGLASLPGWRPNTQKRRRFGGGIDLVASSSTDRDGRFQLGGGPDLRLFGRTWIWSRVRVETSTRISVGNGKATLVHPSAGLGLRGVIGRKHRLELWGGGAGGPLWALGQGFDDNETDLVPRVVVEAGAAWLPPGPLRIGLVGEVPVARLVLVEIGGARRVEPLFRLGLRLGLVL